MTSSSKRFSVGIDLGTTHTALSCLELSADPRDTRPNHHAPRPFAIPQLVQSGEVAARELLPSFLYFPHASEQTPGALALPWDAANRLAIGEWARAHGAQLPARLVSSAKSWLSHPTLDRRSAFLPLGAPDDVAKISPLDASARYLEHLRLAWNHEIAKGDPARALEAQVLTLTVPASFDAVARALTVEAAAQAGLKDVTLLEEPQAALYAWVEALGDRWRDEVSVGDLILVCDVGGGTTDFSLIAVVEQDGELALSRVAVGDHILLGGDNMDLALALALQQTLLAQGKKLDRWQLTALTHGARVAKEKLFANPELDAVPITVPSRGSSLIGRSLSVDLTRATLTQLLVEGFFPEVEVDSVPNTPKRLGLTTLGLPYAADAAVTRHLAAFLMRHVRALSAAETKLDQPVRGEGKRFLHPTAVLFNGGVMKATELKDRVMSVLQSWVRGEGGALPRELPGCELDLAVAQGAAVFGRVRQGQGIRIRGGTARAYYVGIETAMPAVPGMPPPLKALCLAPMGMEEGTSAELPDENLGLVVGEPAQFRLFGSTVRRDDVVGTVVEDADVDALDELPPVEATLPATDGLGQGDIVPIHLRAHVTEIGTLELACVGKAGQAWKLEFDLRGQTPEMAQELELDPSDSSDSDEDELGPLT
ncbi:MAG: Hsp70 family protein [Myxococcales bacterium]|jgi:hypothetical protein|nr:Hsp70 family protein [Myxococcales bacterium]